jgi:hypothetical protein
MSGNQDQPATADFHSANKRTDLRRSYEKIKIGFLGAEGADVEGLSPDPPHGV